MNPLLLLRDLAPGVLGAVTRRHGDFADAEDAVQEALIAAAAQWPAVGIPTNPAGWLYQVAIRRLQDQVRADVARRRREDAVAMETARAAFVAPRDADIGVHADDSLLLLFMCCHPALTDTSAIALTLRAVGGLTTAEIARAFLMPEATMAQRISRAKASIKASGVPLSMPTSAERTERLPSVLHVLYLIFNEGYASSSGPTLQRVDLSNEAIRLTRGVRALLPEDSEVAGLLSLMLLTDARRAARTGPVGELIPLDEQDRSRWNSALIAEGVQLTRDALGRGAVGPYGLQAAIAALHDEAPRVEDTDWPQILALYEILDRMSDNPMVTLNRVIAAAMTHGPAEGLVLLNALEQDPRIRGHYRVDAVRAHLLERDGRGEDAIVHYGRAAERTANAPERDYLLLRITRLVDATGTGR